MTNKENLSKKVIYRSTHRGSKEMDILLGNFVKKHIKDFSANDLEELILLLEVDDEEIYNWYFKNSSFFSINENKITKLLRKFKI